MLFLGALFRPLLLVSKTRVPIHIQCRYACLYYGTSPRIMLHVKVPVNLSIDGAKYNNGNTTTAEGRPLTPTVEADGGLYRLV